MKLNGNNKTEINHVHSTDRVAINAVNKMEINSLRNFDMNVTWQKIAKKLSNVDKQMLSWGLAMAASMSLLIAANIETTIFDEELFFPIEDLFIVESNNSTPQGFMASGSTQRRSTPKLDGIEPITVSSEDLLVIEPIMMDGIEPNAPNKNVLTHQELFYSTNKKDIQPLRKNPFITIQGQASFFTNGNVMPEFGIDFKLKENYTSKRREILKLGFSTQIYYSTSVIDEVKTKQMTPYVFANLTYINLDKETNKGWTGKAGYLFNPDGVYYQDTTIKVSVLRNIGKHIKIGPEIIFTNTFSKIYPGFSLILG